jgi:nucleoside 2-deoxyribosyltransferase
VNGIPVILFIGFYLSGLLIKFQPIQFYELFGVTHVIDLVWFVPYIGWPLRPLLSRGNLGEEAARRFIALDLLTLAAIAGYFWSSGIFASKADPTYPRHYLAITLLAIGAADLLWNGSFYFHRIGRGARRHRNNSAVSVNVVSGNVYFAGPLFTQAEWQWNKTLKILLEKRGLKISLPQEIAMEVWAEKRAFDPGEIYLRNISAIGSAAAVIAVLDGADADSGTTWECGYAHQSGKPIIGVRTDLRLGGDDAKTGTNLMLGKSCRKVVCIPPDVREDLEYVADEIAQALVCAISATSTPAPAAAPTPPSVC